MSLHYYLDGYNIVHQVPALADLPVEEARAGLVRILERDRPQGSPNNRVTVVFDGGAGFWGGPEPASAAITVVFSGDVTADERIKQDVERTPQRRDVVLVSDDRALRYYVRALGARVMDVAEFLALGGRGRPAPPAKDGGKTLPRGAQEKLNRELRDIWLKKRQDDPEP